jgi:hypothetical protein
LGFCSRRRNAWSSSWNSTSRNLDRLVRRIGNLKGVRNSDIQVRLNKDSLAAFA